MGRHTGSGAAGTYFDPTYKGIDLKEHVKAVQEKVDAAPAIGMAYALIAQSLLDVNDSHTYFIPPMRTNTNEYGWQMQIIGDDCFVVAVQPGSDADAGGLKPGDRLLRVEPFAPSRRDLWKLQYAYNVLQSAPVRPGRRPEPWRPAARIAAENEGH